MFFRLVLIAFLSFITASRAFAENSLSTEEEPDSDQSDIYYNAMLRSIDLDKKRWKTFSRSMESGPWFYDTQSLKRSGSKVTAMVTVFPHPKKTMIYRSVYRDHFNIKKIVFETEINCTAHTYRQPQIRVYGYYKELLADYSNTRKYNYSSIKPGTTTDSLRNILCGPGKKKRS